jgi:hypothetical protein
MLDKIFGTLEKKLLGVFILSLFIRIVISFILPKGPTNFAPDEATYSMLSDWVFEKKELTDFPNFGVNLYIVSRSLILPSLWLMHLGLDSMQAIRLVSNAYALLTLIVLYAVGRTFFGKFQNLSVKSQRSIFAASLVYAFLPSHFLWGTLALRESATEFWSVTSVLIFLNLFVRNNSRDTLARIIMLTISIVMLFQARPQVGWVVGVALLLCSLLLKTKAQKLIASFVIVGGMFLGWQTTTPNILELETKVVKELRVADLEKAKSQPNQSVIESPISSFTTNITSSQQANLDRQVGAESKIESFNCPIEKSISEFNIVCYLMNVPRVSFIFMFKPIVGLDELDGFSKLAGLENIVWILMALILVTLFVKNGRNLLGKSLPIAPVIVILTTYVVGASASEGNMGTAFRHKSFTLWCLMLLIGFMINSSNSRVENKS